MKTVIAIIGKAGSGKDTLQKKLLEMNDSFHGIVSCTTRPPREYEVDGQDYHFLTPEQFTEKILNGDMLESTEFNDWFYGTMKSDLIDGINIGVFNPEGFDFLNFGNKDLNVIGIYLKTSDKIRLLRQLNREDSPDVPEIIRRYSTDVEDFYELDYETLPANVRVFDNYDTVAELLNAVDEILDLVENVQEKNE